MAHGRADSSNTLWMMQDASASTVTDGRGRTDAMARVRGLLAASGAKASPVVFSMRPARVDRPRGGTTPRGPRFPLVRLASCDASGSPVTSAPSQFAAVIHDDGGRAASSAAVLIAVYVLLVALLMLGGCAPTPVSSAPGVDRAAGTGLQISDHADAILRDVKGMQ